MKIQRKHGRSRPDREKSSANPCGGFFIFSLPLDFSKNASFFLPAKPPQRPRPQSKTPDKIFRTSPGLSILLHKAPRMKTLHVLLPLLALAACQGRGNQNGIDPRSIEYNNRAEEALQRFLHEEMPDTTAWAQAETFSDSVRVLFRDVVDSCQTLLDSAVMYSPQSHLYYARKATLYLYCLDYGNALVWMKKALEKKDLPSLRLSIGMLLQKTGDEPQARTWYHQAADQYRALDTLSQADKVNYALALALAGEKEQARKAIDSLIKDSPAREQLLRTLENPQGTLDDFLP